jgi:hypothetical protein
MLADAASLAVMLIGAKAQSGSSDVAPNVVGYAGIAGLVVASPLIHAFGHRQYGRATLSFVIRGAPLIGALVLANSCHGGEDACLGQGWGSVLLTVVASVGMVVDWTALSWEQAEPARVAVVPLVGKRNGAALAVRF